MKVVGFTGVRSVGVTKLKPWGILIPLYHLPHSSAQAGILSWIDDSIRLEYEVLESNVMMLRIRPVALLLG